MKQNKLKLQQELENKLNKKNKIKRELSYVKISRTKQLK